MSIRRATALTALALAATAAGLAGCSGGSNSGGTSSSGPASSPVAAAQGTTPLGSGDFRVALDGAVTGNLSKTAAASCEIDSSSYDLKLTGTVNGVSTVIGIDNLEYKQPGQIALRGNTDITADIAQSDAKKDWRNQGYEDGDGTITYNPDGRSGSFDITVPEISYETAAILPGNPKLHLAGRWSCGLDTASS